MKYLIVKCELLSDQYECDAKRTPITMTDDYHTWYKVNKPNYRFEVYEFSNSKFKCIRDYDKAEEEGMALVWYDNDTPEGEFNIIKKYPNKSRYETPPKEVQKYYKKAIDVDDSRRNCGYINFELSDRYVAYTEYQDSMISCPY